MKIRNRKALFLHSTILRGRRLRDENEQGGGTGGDGIEVSPGFAEAAARMSGDDNRTTETGASDDAGNNPVDENANGGASGDNGNDAPDGGNDDGEDGAEDAEGKRPQKKRDTAEYIRELKNDRREARRQNAELQARLEALEKGGLQNQGGNDNSSVTSEKPDANDATKYPLGVLDDGYITDMIAWGIADGLAKERNGRLQTEQEQAEQARQTEHLTALRNKVDDLADRGSQVYDDYEEKVLEAGLRGDYQLTETTFTAAAESEHAVDILYALASDKAEAKRVAELTPYQQIKYVAQKDAEIAAKKKARSKPQAGQPPQNSPRGRDASSPIRPDTDNLDDFRKLFYADKK